MEATFRNVNHAFHTLVEYLHKADSGEFGDEMIESRRQGSRAGEVLMLEEPLLLTYTHPRERVLMNPRRNINPFFSLYETLWMLAGRCDVRPLAYYNQRMPDFANAHEELDGSYGSRWRTTWGDQLNEVVAHLRENPLSRRAVLTMWSGRDLYRADARNGGYSKDVPCNTHCYLAVRDGALDITVCNRSNDILWGMLGSDFVTFSILHEYLALRLGLSVGLYHHFTNNLHAYVERWNPREWLKDYEDGGTHSQDWYPAEGQAGMPLLHRPEVFDAEVCEFVERHSRDAFAGVYAEPFLRDVAQPLCIAWHHVKRGDDQAAFGSIRNVADEDWRQRATQWLVAKRAAEKKIRGTVRQVGDWVG